MATPNTSFHDPGATNVFIPAATSQLQVEFSRNPASFRLADYMQIIPGQALVGLFPELSSTDPVTVVNERDTLWPDGQERPYGRKRPFRWKQWRAVRHAYPYTLGNLTVEQASFDIIAAHGRGEAAHCMTERTLDAITVLETAANWPAANTAATVDALLAASSGQNFYTGTAANQWIKSGINAIKQAIQKQTGGVVNGSMLCMVLNPVTADNMARSPEIREYMVNHERAFEVLRGQERRVVDDWGLPPDLYGVKVCVEDAVRQTTKRVMAGTGTVGYVMADNKIAFVSLVGGLIGVGAQQGEGLPQAAPSFTTLTGFFQEEMTVETEVDGWNRLTKGSVVDTRDIVLTAPNSGFLLQDAST